MHKCVSFRAFKEDGALLRTETLYGREWLVVPVIALVEGVLQGMNAAVPELALFEEFGRTPEGWDGRPLVMNHPTVNGIPVSANSPIILEQYAFGMLFNTKAEDLKLKTEAWIDLERVTVLANADIDNTIERLRAGEIIEVSTGLFTGVEATKGTYNGEEFDGIWRGITPDHLAFLSAGVIGACSVADGAGAPRINQASATWPEFKMPATLQMNAKASDTPGVTGVAGARVVISNAADSQQYIEIADVKTNEQQAQEQEHEPTALEVLARLTANTIPANLLSSDVHSLLCAELRKMLDRSCWVFGFTNTDVVYEIYDYGRETYIYMRRSFSIADDKTVTFGSEVEEVRLVTEIVPASPSTAGLTVQASKEKMMAEENPGEVKPNESGTVTTVTSPATAPIVNSEVAKPRTMSEYLGDMPAEMREVVQNGLKLHAAKKVELISGLKASGRCKFDDARLNSMDLETLENLAELAAVPKYEGTATPKTRVNAADNDEVPAPPALFG